MVKIKELTKDYNIIFAVLLLMIFFTITSPVFIRGSNLMNILLQTTTVAIVAIGQTSVLITGQLDLSLGQNVCLSGMASAYLMCIAGWNPWISIFIGIIISTVVGLLNGIITNIVKIPAFITTLGMQLICRGAAKLITNTKTVAPLSPEIAVLGRGFVFGFIPVSVVIMLVLFAIMTFVFSRTRTGRYFYAIGGNPEAAFFSGINVKKYRIIAFVLAGFFAGVSASILISRLNSANIGNGNAYEFSAMIGCVLGGVSLFGGKGKVISAFIGVMLSVILFNGMTLLNVNSFLQDVFTGVVLLVAMAIDVIRNKTQERFS